MVIRAGYNGLGTGGGFSGLGTRSFSEFFNPRTATGAFDTKPWKTPQQLLAENKDLPIYESALGATVPLHMGTRRRKLMPIEGSTPVYRQQTTIRTGKGGGTTSTSSRFYFDFVGKFAWNPFQRAAKLLKIEFDDVVVYDVTAVGSNNAVAFTFHDGVNNDFDPVLQSHYGLTEVPKKNPFIFISFKAADAEPYGRRVPIIHITVSDSYSTANDTGALAWTGAVPTAMPDLFLANRSCIDPTDLLIYQGIDTDRISSGTQSQLVTFDLGSRTEVNRVQLPADVDRLVGPVALPGSGLVFGARYDHSFATLYRADVVIDAASGVKIAEYVFDVVDRSTPYWKAVTKFDSPEGTKYLLAGYTNDAATRMMVAIVDVAAGTIEEFSDTGFVLDVFGDSIVSGYAGDGFASAYFTEGETIYVIDYNGDGITISPVHTPASGTLLGVYYDSKTDVLVVPVLDGTARVDIVDPGDGAVLDTVAAPVTLTVTDGPNNTSQSIGGKPGFCYLYGTGASGITLSGKVYLFDIAANALTLVVDTSVTHSTSQMTRFHFLQSMGYFFLNSAIWTAYAGDIYAADEIGVEDEIESVAGIQDIAPAQITFVGTTAESNYGVSVSADTNTRAMIDTICEPHGIKWADVGYGLTFRKIPTNGSYSIDFAITSAMLMGSGGDDPSTVTTDEEDEVNVPISMSISYVDLGADYETVETPPVWQTNGYFEWNETTRQATISTQIVLDATKALRFAGERLFDAEEASRRHNCSVDHRGLVIEPTDIITMPSGASTYLGSVTSVSYGQDFHTEIEMTGFAATLDSEWVGVTATVYEAVAQATGPMQYLHLDGPLLLLSDDVAGAGLLTYHVIAPRLASPNSGGYAMRGTSALDLTQFADEYDGDALIGIAISALAAPANYWVTEEDGELIIGIQSGSADQLVSRTHAEVMNGANAALFGQPGRWELIAFETVTDNGDGTFTLAILQRGIRGSEVYAGSHALGDRFVLLDPDFVGKSVYEVGFLDSDYYFKAVGHYQNPDDVPVVSRTITGTAETPYAPVNIAAAIVGSDIVITWDWRSRLDHIAILTGTADTVHGEASLSFEVDIIDGTAVVQTLTVSTNSATYLDADITADFGTMPATINVEVYQISALVGRGYVGAATIIL